MTGPEEAVHAWWGAMQRQDLAGLEAVTLEDFMSTGGPAGRELGRKALIEGATEFFAGATIDSWQVDDLEIREVGDVAVCSYSWSETGTFGDHPFDLRGVATDVLVHRDGAWRHQAHHFSMAPDQPE